MTASEVPPAPVPAYPGAGLPAAEVARILHRLDPAALQEAGSAHTALGRELDTMAAQLTRESQILAQHWSGVAARRALAQFQRLHTQTATLAAQASRTGAVLTWLGTQVVPAFRDPSSSGQSQQYLTALSAALVQASTALPSEIGAPDPAHLASAAPGPTPSDNPGDLTVPGSPAASSSSAAPSLPAIPRTLTPGHPNGPADLMSTTSNTPGGHLSPNNPASLPDRASTTDPASLNSHTGPSNPGSAANLNDPASPGTTTTPIRTQPAPLASRLQSAAPDPAPSASPAHTAPDAPADPAPTPAATTGTPAPAPLTSRLTRAKQPTGPHPVAQDSGLSGGALPLQPTPTGPASFVATPAPANPASHHTPGALPLAGGAATQPDHERHRDSWAPEDRNPWGLPDTCVPPLIEGPDPAQIREHF